MHQASVVTPSKSMDYFASKILEYISSLPYVRNSREQRLCFARDLSLVVLGVR
jgi:hypothetical protein